MPLSIQQSQKQVQRLIMTPQMQQAVKLLQMNTMQLEEYTQLELMENPFLELEEDRSDVQDRAMSENMDEGAMREEIAREAEAELDVAFNLAEKDDSYDTIPEHPLKPSEYPPENAADNYDAAPGDRVEAAGEFAGESAGDSDAALGDSDRLPDPPGIEEQPEHFSEVDTDWSEVFEDGDTRTYAQSLSGGDEEERSFEEVVAGRESLYEMLEKQLRLCPLQGAGSKIGHYLIGCIDERGYLRTPLEECAEHFGASIDAVKRILAVIQEFDPPGVGARDLPECLCLQLKAMDELTPFAEEVLRGHWDMFSKKKFKEIARAMKADEEDVRRLFNRIQRLNPAPGRAYTKEQPLYISPDVYVKRMEGRYVIYLNEGQMAHLRLNNDYREILLNGSGSLDAKSKEFAVEKYRSAVLFIKNIEKRRNTVLRVTEAIMEHQQDFLEKGVEFIKPLALSEIAARVGMHEATISRVTRGKYVDTPQGLYELKYFFSSSLESNDGEAASASTAVRQKILTLVKNEDPARPLSDDKIAKMLVAQGINIARRTVTKYREQLKILPASMRRKKK